MRLTIIMKFETRNEKHENGHFCLYTKNIAHPSKIEDRPVLSDEQILHPRGERADVRGIKTCTREEITGNG